MKKQLLIIALALLPLGLTAQEQGGADSPATEKSGHSRAIYTGFSGGMMLHGGYMFTDSPEKVFSNSGLGSPDYVKGLPKSGFCYGLGGALRVHLIDHIHLGAEGFVSTMPLMNTGSNVRTSWGGVFCDYYGHWGKARPMIGLTIGGGTMKRLFVPDKDYVPVGETGDTTNYNASYIKTPVFLLDPYIGMEFGLGKHMALLIRIDYVLPFQMPNNGISKLGDNLKWSSFITPSGPRLYVGVMFGTLTRK